MGNTQTKRKGQGAPAVPEHLGNFSGDVFAEKVLAIVEKELFAQAMGAASGAVILKKSDLSVVAIGSTKDVENPAMTAEIDAIEKYYQIPKDQRPAVLDCIFLTTHVPSPFGLAAISLCKFDNIIYLNPTAHARDTSEDENLWNEVFGLTSENLRTKNKYWTSYSLSDLAAGSQGDSQLSHFSLPATGSVSLVQAE